MSVIISESAASYKPTNPLWVVAKKEWLDGRRNRWLQSVTIILFLLALGIAYFGGAVAGQVGFTGLSNTIVSLASLAVLIMPLVALLLSYDAIVGEDESGTLLLLSAYPITLRQLYLGKFLGRCSVLGASIIVGFFCAALVLALTTSVVVSDLLIAFSVFVLAACLLGFSFVAIGLWVSSYSASRAQAAGISLVIWFVGAVLFDLVVLGVLVLSQGHLESNVLAGLLFMNPTDIFRMINFSLFADMQQHTGLMSLQQDIKISLPYLFVLSFAWLLVPLAAGYVQFKKRMKI